MLDGLFDNDLINVNRSKLFQSHPVLPPVDFDKIEGMMLGLAAGDSLGNTSESQNPEDRRRRKGEITDYIPNGYADNRRIGLPSDDTQLAFWTLEQLIEDKRFVPEHVAACFAQGQIYGIGGSVKRFLGNYKTGSPWYRAGIESAGNGALMRIAPMLIPHLKPSNDSLWVDTALAAMITHNESASISSCVAFIDILVKLISFDGVPDPEWWPETYIAVAKDLENDYSLKPRNLHLDYQGTLWQFVADNVYKAYKQGKPVLEACNYWYSGAYLLETVPSVLYILMKHADDPEQAIIRAVNDTRDNDTVAAIVGAAVGALHGKKALPDRWIENLSGRTSDSDDGHIFELLSSAKAIWGK
jgi:ADP-ribosylglycohydrolase